MFFFILFLKVLLEELPLNPKVLFSTTFYTILMHLFYRRFVNIQRLKKYRIWYSMVFPFCVFGYMLMDFVFYQFPEHIFLKNVVLFGALGLLHGVSQMLILGKMSLTY